MKSLNDSPFDHPWAGLGFLAPIRTLCIALVALNACSKDKPSPTEAYRLLPHVADGPVYVREASKAVALVANADGSRGTGTFVTPDGVFLTNHHVLGPTTCPLEGCFIRLHFDFQKGAERSSRRSFYAKPLYSDAKLDVSFVQLHEVTDASATHRTLYLADDPLLREAFAKDDPTSLRNMVFPNGVSSARFTSPAHLEIDRIGPDDLKDQEVALIGHHLGGLKKFSTTRVFNAQNAFGTLRTLTFPGSSGSPVINKNKRLIGVHHSGLLMQNALVPAGYRDEAFFTVGNRVARALDIALQTRDAQGAGAPSLALLESGEREVRVLEPYRDSGIDITFVLPGQSTAVGGNATAEASDAKLLSLRTIQQYKCLAASGQAKPDPVEQQAWDFALLLKTQASDQESTGNTDSADAIDESCRLAVSVSPCLQPTDSAACLMLSEPLQQAFADLAKASIDNYDTPSYFWSVTAPALVSSPAQDQQTQATKKLAEVFANEAPSLTAQLAWLLSGDSIHSAKGTDLGAFATSQDLGSATEKETTDLIWTVIWLAWDEHLELDKARSWLLKAQNRQDLSMSNLAVVESHLEYYFR
jgi:hypothetical protein